jgi:hypothetical protein
LHADSAVYKSSLLKFILTEACAKHIYSRGDAQLSFLSLNELMYMIIMEAEKNSYLFLVIKTKTTSLLLGPRDGKNWSPTVNK